MPFTVRLQGRYILFALLIFSNIFAYKGSQFIEHQTRNLKLVCMYDLGDVIMCICVTNMLRVLMDKVDSMQEQMGNVSREMEILRENQKEMLEMKNTVTEMKNTFDGLINRLDTAEERLSELEAISIEISKTEKQREQKLKK